MKTAAPSIFLVAVLALPCLARAQATDVDCDKCVDSTDIAAEAVRTAKIRNGTITNADIANDAIVSSHVRDGTIKGRDFAAGTIKGNRIMDATLTKADFALDSIPGDRLRNATLQAADIADRGIGGDKLAADAVFSSTILVRSDPADPVANCGRLQAALASIPANNMDRKLIRLEPGIFDCSNGGASSNVIMKPFVDIEGSGQGITVIEGDSYEDGEGVVRMAANSELRFLTIDNLTDEENKTPHAIAAPVPASAAFVTLITRDQQGVPFNEPIDCTGIGQQTLTFVLSNSVVRAENDATSVFCNGVVYIETEVDADLGFDGNDNRCFASWGQEHAPLDNDCEEIEL